MRIDSSFIADFIFAVLIYFLLLFTVWKNKGTGKIILNSIFYFYIVAVFTVTVMPVIENIKFIGSFPYRFMRLIPFDDYNCGRAAAVKQIVLNTVMFVPFGFILPLIRKQNLITVTIFSALFSVFIEVFQPFISAVRYSDITDVITNTLGGIIGYLVYLLFKKLSKREELI